MFVPARTELGELTHSPLGRPTVFVKKILCRCTLSLVEEDFRFVHGEVVAELPFCAEFYKSAHHAVSGGFVYDVFFDDVLVDEVKFLLEGLVHIIEGAVHDPLVCSPLELWNNAICHGGLAF